MHVNLSKWTNNVSTILELKSFNKMIDAFISLYV